MTAGIGVNYTKISERLRRIADLWPLTRRQQRELYRLAEELEAWRSE